MQVPEPASTSHHPGVVSSGLSGLMTRLLRLHEVAAALTSEERRSLCHELGADAAGTWPTRLTVPSPVAVRANALWGLLTVEERVVFANTVCYGKNGGAQELS